MANIIPAILTDNINELQDKLNLLSEVCEWAQVDLMDGKFVPTRSVTPEELAAIGTEINLEAHLMVADPAAWLDHLNADIFQRVYFHIEAVAEPNELIKAIRDKGLEVGIAINPETPLTAIEEYAEYVDGVLFMSVDPGRQGQPFKPEVLERITEFSREYPETDTAIDGGVNKSNIYEVSEAGVTNICVGSAIFADGNVAENLQALKDALT